MVCVYHALMFGLLLLVRGEAAFCQLGGGFLDTHGGIDFSRGNALMHRPMEWLERLGCASSTVRTLAGDRHGSTKPQCGQDGFAAASWSRQLIITPVAFFGPTNRSSLRFADYPMADDFASRGQANFINGLLPLMTVASFTTD